MRSSFGLALMLLVACSPSDGPVATSDDPAAAKQSISRTPQLGTTPHEAVEVEQLVGVYTAPNGDLLVLKANGEYAEAKLDGGTDEGAWYAFGGHLELYSSFVLQAIAPDFDLVGIDDELFLVDSDRLSKFTLEARLGVGFSPSWLRRAATADEPRPALPPPFDEIVKSRGGEFALSEWRAGDCVVLSRPGEILHIDGNDRFDYRGNGDGTGAEKTVGGAAVMGELILLASDNASGAPHFAERMLFAPIRRGARRYLVPCDDVADFAQTSSWAPGMIDSFYLNDGAEPESDAWTLPRAFAGWCRAEPLTARVVRVGTAGLGADRVNVVTLDVGRTQGAFRGQLLSEVEIGANELRVVLVRENDCDAVALNAKDDYRPKPLGTLFDSKRY